MMGDSQGEPKTPTVEPQAEYLAPHQAIAMYLQWYALLSNGPFQGNYQTVLCAFDPDNTNIDPATLLDQVLGSIDIPQAFAVICVVGNKATI